eukprot:2932694-Pyramimonas_sp.AAC.1
MEPALECLLERPSALQADGVDGSLHFALAEAHRRTFFIAQGATSTAESRRGTRPGNGLADL